MSSKKVVVELDLHDGKDKQKALRVVSKLPRIDSIAMDMKAKKLTVIGDVDPIAVVNRLRKYWPADIASVGLAKEPEKKKDAVGGGGGGDIKDGKKKDYVDSIPVYNPHVMPYYPQPSVTYNPHASYPQHVNSHYPLPPPMPAHYASFHEEDPNGCAIC